MLIESKLRFNDLCFFKSYELLQTQSHHFRALVLDGHPLSSIKKSLTVGAILQLILAFDSFRHIYILLETVDTQVASVGLDHETTLATPYHHSLAKLGFLFKTHCFHGR